MEINKNKFIIDEKLSKIRLDKAVTILLKENISRMAAQRMLEEGNILINRKYPKGFI